MKYYASYGVLFVFTLIALLVEPINAEEPDENWQAISHHLKLLDNLDREDGYCIDVVGSGEYIRFDMPLVAHNCKEGLFADEAVLQREDGTILFPAYGGCVTVMGMNNHALPYNALMVKKCNENGPFLKATNFQKFSINEDKQLQLNGTALCLTVGDTSRETYSPEHRWRSLYMQTCQVTDKARSQWQFVKPSQP